MSTSEKITTGSIKEICEKYGFCYEKKEKKHFATVCEELEVRFGEDGKLRGGRQAFLERARKVNREFRKDYPGNKKTSEKAKGKGKGEETPLTELSLEFLDKYSADELDTAMELTCELIGRKRKLEELDVKIGNAQEKLETLRGLAKAIKEAGLEPYAVIAPQIKEFENELAVLDTEKKTVEKPNNVGEEGKESTEPNQAN